MDMVCICKASVKMLHVSVKTCEDHALLVRSGASAKATQCEFSENGESGVIVSGGSKGIFTDCTIHHNGMNGVVAFEEGTLVELRGQTLLVPGIRLNKTWRQRLQRTMLM